MTRADFDQLKRAAVVLTLIFITQDGTTDGVWEIEFAAYLILRSTEALSSTRVA